MADPASLLREKLLKNHPSRRICDERTNIVIEGYPRSANSFTFTMLMHLLRDGPAMRIAHHTHSIENLRLGNRFGKPVVVLLRPPQDAILSYAIYSGCSVEFAAQRYEQFYNGVLNLKKPPVVLEFGVVTGNFNQAVRLINKALNGSGCDPVPLSSDLDADIAILKSNARSRANQQHGGEETMKIGLPSEQREVVKSARIEEVRTYLEKKPEAEVAYRSVLRLGRSQGKR
jgi:hypothetical protein